MTTENRAWPLRTAGIAYGGDYNPEQWPVDVQLEDVELMREAGVGLVSVAIFSWAQLEPREGEFDFGWLDAVLDRLHAAGIGVALATATASPPPWLTRKHPEILPELADGTVLHQGSRQSYAVSSPVFRDYACRMTRRMAERYGDHPALAVWHVDNELGCHVPHDFSDASAEAFADGSAVATAPSRLSTPLGQRPSGPSATTPSRRSCRREPPPRSSTRRSSWTSHASPPTSSSSTTGPFGTYCARSPRTCRRRRTS